MKFLAIFILLVSASFASAKTICNSEKNGGGKLLTLKKQDIMLNDVHTDDIYLFRYKPVKVVEFYNTGGPEQGLTVVSEKGVKFDIWCTDQTGSTDD